jgi:tRNA(fMet)-specific endonuclease VapC
VILLDTDHITVFKYGMGDRYHRLLARLAASPGETVGVTVVGVEEQMRGWISAIARERRVQRQVIAYLELAFLFSLLCRVPDRPL